MSRSVWPCEPTIYLLRCLYSELAVFWDVNPNTLIG